ncbi:hypothetical protein BJF90_20670 [Pseudonocardia sp. CNS-004]|nr:hypothetical protein BJF90_20670 [Pseudonocardia sp. CNS-004]
MTPTLRTQRLLLEPYVPGLGTELAAAIVTYGFDGLGLTEVHATVAAPNTASLGVLRKIGFEHVRDIEEPDIEERDGRTVRVLTRRAVTR